MDKIINTITIGLLIVSLASCRKALPDSIAEDPIFTIEGVLDGQDLKIAAGENDYLMDPDLSRDSWNVNELSGELRKVNCTDCKEVLKITFRDVRVSTPADVIDVGQVLHTGSYEFAGGQQESDPLAFAFEVKSQGQGPFTYSWDLGDGTISPEAAPIHEYVEGGSYYINLTVEDANGCLDNARHLVTAGDLLCAEPIAFKHSVAGNGEVNFSLSPELLSSRPSRIISWVLGDGGSAFATSQFNYSYQRPAIYGVKLIYTDTNGCMSCDFQNIYSALGPSCAATISYKALPKDRDTKRIHIKWTDKNGRTYSSRSSENQPRFSRFQVKSIANYDRDWEGDASKKINIKMDCRLFAEDDTSVFLDFKNVEAVVAVGSL